ncbi:membrane protein UL56 [Macacine alphaherpesvirus 1]|uniref:Membrane protein UL56 n=1 Tax=Macacine alphaherpesvirus 2 TaxID=2845554 RepID=A0A1X9WG01_9ALPH|nr:membrane protein UL56 [Macacine alphaherpesvirus 1]ARS01694.1 membrane protein UL56 [Macacine alphaherpesvirus 2]
MALTSPRARLHEWMLLAYDGSRSPARSLPEDAPPPYTPPPGADAAFVSIDIGDSDEAPPPYSPPGPLTEVRPSLAATGRTRRAQRRAARRSRRRADRRAARRQASSPSSDDAVSSPALPTYREAILDVPPPYDTVVFVGDHDAVDPRPQASSTHPQRPPPSRLSRAPRVSSRELYRFRQPALVRDSPRGRCCSTLTHAHVILGVLLLVVIFLFLFLGR